MMPNGVTNIEQRADIIESKISKLVRMFPDQEKALRLIQRKTIVKEISFSGDKGCFDENGNFVKGNKHQSKAKIIYSFEDVTEHGKQKVFMWLG